MVQQGLAGAATGREAGTDSGGVTGRGATTGRGAGTGSGGVAGRGAATGRGELGFKE